MKIMHNDLFKHKSTTLRSAWLENIKQTWKTDFAQGGDNFYELKPTTLEHIFREVSCLNGFTSFKNFYFFLVKKTRDPQVLNDSVTFHCNANLSQVLQAERKEMDLT